jgi:spore coat protein I
MAIDYCSLLENNYGLCVKRLAATSGGQLAECDDGRIYVFKQSRSSPEKIICTQVALKHLTENGFAEGHPYIETISGLPYASYGGSCYTLSPAPAGRDCVLEDAADLAAASALLARLHRAAKGFTAARAAEALKEYEPLLQEKSKRKREDDENNSIIDPDMDYANSFAEENHNNTLHFKCDLGKTPETFHKRLGELRRFRKVAKKRRDPFDYEYAAIADYYCDIAAEICRKLDESDYINIAERYKEEGCLCHREYTSHNILMKKNSGENIPEPSAVLGFDSVCIEMPVYDLANFIRRRMRKCGWNAEDAENIVTNYNKVRNISREERRILCLLLQFPQKLWRIVNKYYNSRRTWCEKNCLAKLQEIKEEKEPLEEFSRLFS